MLIFTTKYEKFNSCTNLYTIFVKSHTFTFFTLSIFMSVWWDVKWCPVSSTTIPVHAKVLLLDFDEPRSWEPLGKLQNFTIDYCLLIVTAVIWLKCCRYCVKPYSINQSTVLLKYHAALPVSRSLVPIACYIRRLKRDVFCKKYNAQGN